jgi:tetratricopeptide (TPR) repeat protein
MPRNLTHAALYALDGIESGAFDETVLRAWRVTEHPLAHVFAAAALMRLGRLPEARAELAPVAAQWDTPERVIIAAGALHFELGNFAESIDCLERAAIASPTAARDALRVKFSLATALGWRREGIDAAERLIALEPARAAAIHGELHRFLASEGNDADALRHLEARERLEPDSAAGEWEAARLLCRLDRFAEVHARIDRALRMAEATPAMHMTAARLLVESGSFATAEDHASAAARLDPQCCEAHILLAELRLWRGDAAAALDAVSQALACDARCAAAHRQRGAALLLQQRYGDAVAAFDTALAYDPSDREAPVFRGEALLRLGRFEEARAQLEAHPMHGSSDHWVIELLLGLVGLEKAAHEKPAERVRRTWLTTPFRRPRAPAGRESVPLAFLSYYELDHALRALAPDAEAILSSGSRAQVSACLWAVLHRLRGNRGPNPTYYDEDRRALRYVGVRSPRAASIRALGLVKTAPSKVALDALSAVIEEYPDSSVPRSYRGELHLWLGNYDAARADLELAIAQRSTTLWAYYGLASLANVEGDPRGALDCCARSIEALGSEAPPIHVHRGEALRRLGRTDDAVRELRRACELNPTRLSGHLNLALAEGDAGGADAQASGYRWLRAQAPGLASDAGFDLGIGEWADDEALSCDAVRALLERMLLMMRGNRASSFTTWVSQGGFIRVARAGLQGDSALERLRGEAPKRWAILRRLLEDALLANG